MAAKNNMENSCVVTQKKIANFLNVEVKEFAEYVIETRAIPNIMDGLRTGARKIIYSGITGDLKSGKKIKLQVLNGDTMKLEYHHGDSSLYNTMCSLSSKHLFNTPLFTVIGQIGSLRIPKVDTASRYLHIKYSKYISLFKKDWELLNLRVEDGKKIEPEYFLPIIPIHLLWRTNSPGFGFSYRGFSYNLSDVIEATMMSVALGSCDNLNHFELRPEINDSTGPGIKEENLIWHENKQCWFNVGEYEIREDEDLLYIKDLPYNVNFKDYEEYLESLKEQYYITDYSPNSGMNCSVDYRIKFPKGRLKLLLTQKLKFFTKMKLYSKLPKLTLNAIDTNGKSILHFESIQELVDCFVKKRLLVYYQRKTKTINYINSEIKNLSEKAKFIDLVCNDKLIISKRPIVDIKKDLVKHNLPESVLKLSIDKLTKEEIDKINQEIGEFKIQLNYVTITTPKEMYINDLIELKKELLPEELVDYTKK